MHPISPGRSTPTPRFSRAPQATAGRRFVGAVFALALVASGCGGAADTGPEATAAMPTAEATPTPTTQPSTPTPEAQTEAATSAPVAEPTATSGPEFTLAVTPTPTPEPTVAPTPRSELAAGQPITSPDGYARAVPATDAVSLANDLVWAEQVILDPGSDPTLVAEAGRVQQVSYRRWSSEDEWDATIWPLIPTELLPLVELQLQGRRIFRDFPTGLPTADYVPAWSIVAPASPQDLLAWYREAEAATGIEWEYLAAINLVETGMGRIRGLSTAGAQGPMQFLPTTWAEVSTGDINDPYDAIQAAAAYLVRRGGPTNMANALFGYNPSQHYVDAVSVYAEIMRRDERTFLGFHAWEIFFFTTAGDLWLPVGYFSERNQPVQDYLAAAPWSLPAP